MRIYRSPLAGLPHVPPGLPGSGFDSLQANWQGSPGPESALRCMSSGMMQISDEKSPVLLGIALSLCFGLSVSLYHSLSLSLSSNGSVGPGVRARRRMPVQPRNHPSH